MIWRGVFFYHGETANVSGSWVVCVLFGLVLFGMVTGVRMPMDVMAFFRRSAGRWRSQRATHHLAFRRAEVGDSNIQVVSLEATDPRIVALCEMHEIDPALAVGGSAVQWLGAMSWDREGEGNHEGQTAFAIVPDPDSPHQGRLLRERGYAEIVPVVGRYQMDEDEGLVLVTEYETMSSQERFWFAGQNVRFRTSTVKRFGGFSTTSFCAEVRVAEGTDATIADDPGSEMALVSLLGW